MEHSWRDHHLRHGKTHYKFNDRMKDCLVRISPSPDGRFMWQFRTIVSYANSVEEAMNYVEAENDDWFTDRELLSVALHHAWKHNTLKLRERFFKTELIFHVYPYLTIKTTE